MYRIELAVKFPGSHSITPLSQLTNLDTPIECTHPIVSYANNIVVLQTTAEVGDNESLCTPTDNSNSAWIAPWVVVEEATPKNIAAFRDRCLVYGAVWYSSMADIIRHHPWVFLVETVEGLVESTNLDLRGILFDAVNGEVDHGTLVKTTDQWRCMINAEYPPLSNGLFRMWVGSEQDIAPVPLLAISWLPEVLQNLVRVAYFRRHYLQSHAALHDLWIKESTDCAERALKSLGINSSNWGK